MAEQANLKVSLCPLHARPDLIDSCAELLKLTWPWSRPERLHRMVAEETSGIPCCLIFIEHKEDAPDVVIGHVRLVTVTCPVTPLSACAENICVHPSKRSSGLGHKLMLLAERYAYNVLECKQMFLFCLQTTLGFYERLSYTLHPVLQLETEGCNLLSGFSKFASWYGNSPREGWEFVYSDGPYASEDDMRLKSFGQETMRKYLTDNSENCGQGQ